MYFQVVTRSQTNTEMESATIPAQSAPEVHSDELHRHRIHVQQEIVVQRNIFVDRLIGMKLDSLRFDMSCLVCMWLIYYLGFVRPFSFVYPFSKGEEM